MKVNQNNQLLRRLEMHNIDRTQLETEWEDGNFEYGGYQEMDGNLYGELYDEYEEEAEYYDEMEGVFDEAEEMELAAELLSISSEEELDQFLGGLFKKVAGGAKKLFRSPVGKALGGMLKGVAKKALPVVGGALGSMIPIPGVGTALGAAAGSAAGKLFGLELEGLSEEDQEFEVARRFVRLAGDAAQEAASSPANVPPRQAAQAALVSAAQKHAPGLVSGAQGGAGGRKGKKNTGRWVRRGRSIVILGID
jgi:hypothetical protein